ncbi:MAG TPA: 3-oxoacyl-[acyl-carrier-protein] synthase III C-terminal domain-containing protein [Puia sp.]|nr:3-oxoacyl-[acyl-carrier-protein] synthase III C-terminal domain-containing protein [Puia sp.]
MYRSIITGSGAYIPKHIVDNNDFLSHAFYSEEGNPIGNTSDRIIDKFSKITGILQRRYAANELSTSQMAARAAELALADSGMNKENLDHIIVAHNFGDLKEKNSFPDIVPSLASRVKHLLNITNPACIPYDLVFGCPGWLQGMIHADAFFKAGIGKNALIIGADILSRTLDPHDRDSMIFSDGAGAVILEYKEVDDPLAGILSTNVRSDAGEECGFIHMGTSFNPEKMSDAQYLKMKGRKVYDYALRHVPAAMKECLDRSGQALDKLKTIFIHQANEKMDDAIVRNFYNLYGISEPPVNIMPMCIQSLGNSSVATTPTLFDLVRRSSMPGFSLSKGDTILFASVGAGMNINAVCYGYL